eukprot:TRINITY_DN28004_c0_g1_i2.p1 TRINITY_DN28004_c0_g1~~TRINITY_DN28004_c0_g1_i2.p1  ORF type:complete len:172 (+),score=50.67 TRINITY_DN28004_c0_g1_i2:251-766(+)
MGVEREVLAAGDGTHFPQPGDRLGVHYTGRLMANGDTFDSSVDKDLVFYFKAGAGEVIKGWDDGLLRMSLGETAKLEISSDLAYGEMGVGPIPANADLEFEVTLISINGRKRPTAEVLAEYEKKLGKWKADKLQQYDQDATVKAKRDKKHGGRNGYEKFLASEIRAKVDSL